MTSFVTKNNVESLQRMGFSLTEDAVIEEIEPAFEDSIQVMDKETLIDSTKIVAKKYGSKL